MSVQDTRATRIGGVERIKLRLGTIVWFLLGLGFLLGLPVLLDIHVLAAVAVVALALILAFPATWLVRRLFAGQRRHTKGMSYFKSVLGLLFGITTLIAAPLYYFAFKTELQPLTVPQATLSNGKKTLVFQGMMHIGSEGFYKIVIYDLEKALSEGYVIFYEGVLPDREGDTWFSETLAGGGDLSANYQAMGDACGLQFQGPYFQLLTADIKARPDLHVQADVTTADMMREYQRLMDTDPDFAAAMASQKPAIKNDSDADQFTQLMSWLADATPGQREILGTACRGWMTTILARKDGPSPLDPVILDFRNRKLAERIEASTSDKIFMTYGAEHLRGLLADLRANDPAWEVKSVKWMRTIETPEDLEGEL